MSSMNLHLPVDRDYSAFGGMVTVSTQHPEDYRFFIEYLSANPNSPMELDIPERGFYRGE